MIGHDEIMQMAKELRRPAATLIVLSQAVDPFFVDTPATRQAGEWFAGIYQQFGFGRGVHLRRIHYRLVSQETPVLDWNGRPYENTIECSNAAGVASVSSRYLGLIPIEDFVDRRNPDPVLHLPETPGEPGFETVNACIDDFPELKLSGAYVPPLRLFELELPELRLPALGDLEAPDPVQPYHIELWCEKTTVSDILNTIARRYGLNVVYGMGELSLTACQSLMRRIADNGGRPVRILYLSDFDPAGQSMPVAVARKIEWLVRRDNPEIDLQLRPIVLAHDNASNIACHEPL